MKKLQKLNFFQHEGLYVVENEIDINAKSMVYIVSELSNKLHSIHHIESINNNLIKLDDIDQVYDRSEIIRVLGLANIPDKFKEVFIDGKVVETGESYNVSKSSKYLEKGDFCNVKDHVILVELLSDEIRQADDEWSWDDEFNAKVLYAHSLEKTYKVDDVIVVKRRNLNNNPTVYINLRCECCNHEIN